MSERAGQLLAWQGWRIELPAGWDPVKFSGNFDAGQVLIANREGPRLGMRWSRARGRSEKALFHKLIAAELGESAARRAMSAYGGGDRVLTIDQDPPGRDMYLYRARSARLIQLIHHAKQRDEVFESQIAGSLSECDAKDWQAWAVFGLACESPPGYLLEGHQLHAGDARLNFGASRGAGLVIRQVYPARMALQRQPLKQWLDAMAHQRRARYRTGTPPTESATGSMPALEMISCRRRRFEFAWRIPRRMLTLAAHDEPRDRLILVQGSDEALVREASRRMAESEPTSVMSLPAVDESSKAHQALGWRPMRAPAVKIDRIDNRNGAWRLTHESSRRGFAARWLGAPATMSRRFELDEIGKAVWDLCDGRTSAGGIAQQLARKYSLHQREAELATMQFLRLLSRRGLIRSTDRESA